MIKLLSMAAFGFGLVASSSVLAAEKTVTLAKNMYCAACPGTVKKSLLDVPGVTNVAVSAEDKTAVVTFDDSKTQVDALVKATTNAGLSFRAKELKRGVGSALPLQGHWPSTSLHH
jgi:mercuric ion binding protein